MRKFLIALTLAVASLPAYAQEQAAPEKRSVLVIGDELAGGLGAGLSRMAEADGTFRIANRASEGTGLSRPELYDWAGAIPKMVEGKNYSTALVLMGLNDRRDIRDPNQKGVSVKFGTPEWETKYKARIDALIDQLAAAHIQVLWLGEPPMGDPAFDADMQNITAMVKERVAAKGATFIDLRAPLLGPQGGFSDRGPDETGADRRLRESDGVTFMKAGNNRLGQIALGALKGIAPPPGQNAPVAAAPVLPAAPAAPSTGPQQQATATPVPPAAPKPPATGPIFGQEGLDATAAAEGSKNLAAAVDADKATKAANATSIIGIGAAKGSRADALFTTGIAPSPPAGRFDDDSVEK